MRFLSGDLTTNIIEILTILPGILIALSFHEFAHAFAAVKLGDDTPRLQGRLTLDPTKHLDPIGFICLLLIGFGWAKPVMINPRNFRNPRRDDIIVSAAGPLANFILAIVITGILGILLKFAPNVITGSEVADVFFQILAGAVYINLVLMVFNLIPLPPLDGHHILGNIIGYKAVNFYRKYASYIRLGLIILLVTGLIGDIIGPPVNFLFNKLLQIFLF